MPRRLTAVVPGLFDPVLRSHIDLIGRTLRFADFVIVAIADDLLGEVQFDLHERFEMVGGEIEAAGFDQNRTIVLPYKTTTIAFACAVGAQVIVHQIAAISEFERGQQLASTNARLDPAVETLFLVPTEQCSNVSGRHLMEVASAGGDISHLVSTDVARCIEKRLAGPMPTDSRS